MVSTGVSRLGAGLLIVLLPLLLQMGCAPREGYGWREVEVTATADANGRSGEATLFLGADGPVQATAQFVIPDLDADRVRVQIEAVSRRPIAATLRCAGPVRVRQDGAPYRPLAAGEAGQIAVPARGRGAVTLDWRPEAGACRVDWGDGHSVALRPETTLPGLAALAEGALACRADPDLDLDPLQKVFLDQGALLQTCPVAPGPVRLLADPIDALSARIEALTGSRVAREVLESGDADLPLDFSKAPRLDLIALSYLHVRADFVGYLTARMLAHHALRGTEVRILVSDALMLEEDRVFYDSLAARYPGIQIQYYRWPGVGLAGPGSLIDTLHRVQHTRAFLALSPEPGRSRFIFGGRNLHDGFFFSKPFDLAAWPFLHSYEQGGFQDLGFYSTYEDLEVELSDDAAVRNVAAHHVALWNRDADTQSVGPVRTAETDRVSGMRHYLSLPWADGRDQVRWFVDAIDAAAEEVLIVTPYLNPPPAIQEALLRARARDVRVRMIARIESTDPAGFIITALNRRYVAENAGRFEIEEYFPRPLMMHTKMMVIDRRLAVTTSTNLDHRAFWHDTENGLIFLDTPEVDALLGVVEDYRRRTRMLTVDEPQHPLSNVLSRWAWLRSVF